MTEKRTELVWTYEPKDFFEAAYHAATEVYDLVVRDGRAVATLKVPQNPVKPGLVKLIAEDLEDFFLVRQLRQRRSYKLQQGPPSIQQHGVGGGTTVTVEASDAAASVANPDVLIQDQAGNVLADTRAARIAKDTAMLDAITSKLAKSPLLRGMLKSYRQSIADPANQLFHLYEVRDALAKYYSGENDARKALNISGADWRYIGRLADHEPIEQSRHRGQHPDRREATADELEKARSIIWKWILAQADIIP